MKKILIVFLLAVITSSTTIAQDSESGIRTADMQAPYFDPEIVGIIEEAKIFLEENPRATIIFVPPGAGDINYKMNIIKPSDDTVFTMPVYGMENEVDRYLLYDLDKNPHSFISGIIYSGLLNNRFEKALEKLSAAAGSADAGEIASAKSELEKLIDDTIEKTGGHTEKKSEFKTALDSVEKLSETELRRFVPIWFSDVHTYPNPFRSKEHSGIKFSTTGISGGEDIFITIRIYDMRGALAKTISGKLTCQDINNYSGNLENGGYTFAELEEVTNEGGRLLSSGVYLYQVLAETTLYTGEYQGRLAVIR